MSINILKNDHFYSIGIYKDSPTLEELKKDRLNILLSMEPILTRAVSYYNHLVEFDPKSDPPKLRWKIDILEQSSIDYLRSICTILEKILEEQTKKY